MKNTKPALENEKLSHVLTQLVKRIEEATVDIHEMKRDLKVVSLKLYSVESNTKIMKVDMEKMRGDIDDLIGMNKEILEKMVTQKEFDGLSRRVAVLEN